jgi:hypothetical protein
MDLQDQKERKEVLGPEVALETRVLQGSPACLAPKESRGRRGSRVLRERGEKQGRKRIKMEP